MWAQNRLICSCSLVSLVSWLFWLSVFLFISFCTFFHFNSNMYFLCLQSASASLIGLSSVCKERFWSWWAPWTRCVFWLCQTGFWVSGTHRGSFRVKVELLFWISTLHWRWVRDILLDLWGHGDKTFRSPSQRFWQDVRFCSWGLNNGLRTPDEAESERVWWLQELRLQEQEVLTANQFCLDLFKAEPSKFNRVTESWVMMMMSHFNLFYLQTLLQIICRS